MVLPPLTVVMTLFIPPTEGGLSRYEGACQTVMSWGRHMRYPGEIRLHIANDSVTLEKLQVERLAGFSRFPVSIGNTSGGGLGAAFNHGMQQAFADGSPLMLYADDSYSLIEDLDLEPWASVLMRHEEIGAVSLMPPRPEQSGGTVKYFHGIRTEGVAGVLFDRKAFVWNGRPLMYHKRFFDTYGPTPEGVTGYAWEQSYAEHIVASKDGPQVLYAFIDPFQHVWSGVRLGDKPPGWDGREHRRRHEARPGLRRQ